MQNRERLWGLVAAERRRLAEDLAGLDWDAWDSPSLCTEWSVEETLAHLVAAASTSALGWMRSMAMARLDPATHNERRLRDVIGHTPEQTLEAFRAVEGSRTAPAGPVWAWLGEVVVHGQDIREPLGIATLPSLEAVTTVAAHYARQDFAVDSARRGRGIALRATDSAFRHGEGPEAVGTTLDLVMALAGRPTAAARLEGPGAARLLRRSGPVPAPTTLDR